MAEIKHVLTHAQAPVLVLTLVATLVGVGTANEAVIIPSTIELQGPAATQQLSVVWKSNDKLLSMAEPSSITWKIANPTVAEVAGASVRGKTDGTTQLEATVRDAEGKVTTCVSVAIIVKNSTQPRAVSFRNEVQNILARQGCNSGACHGALAGKGGFRLSLRGYDPETDWFSITREAQGRRVELVNPGESLILMKPTGAVAHKGGLRLNVDSEDYQIIAQWIAAGAPRPTATDPKLDHIRVLPEQSQLTIGERQRILVQAHYDDGSVADVTRWTKFSASDEAVATVDEHGLTTVRGPGEGAIVAWFNSKIALSRVVVPYAFAVPQSVYEQSIQRNFIDQHVMNKLRELHLQPAAECDDAEFVRRVMVDAVGRLPSLTEATEFIADPRPEKRSQLIDSILERPDYVDFWTYKWSDLLLLSGNNLRPAGIKAYYTWIREQVQKNTPWDEFVRQILVAQGKTTENGATNFYAVHQDPELMTENACQAFMGLSIGCAKCHNHPLEKWTNDQYYAMANLFARVRGKGWGGDSRNGDGIRTVYVVSDGDLVQPRLGKAQPPTPLDGTPLEMHDPADRRVHLAAWMTGPNNIYFARSIVNRVWANFMKIGLVEQVDDLRLSNPASNEPLLTALAEHLVNSQYDLKQLMREIMRSATYQRTSQTVAANFPDQRFYSHYYPRRLMAEVLLDGIDQVLETQSKFEFVAFAGADKQKTDFYPQGTRAIQLYDAAVESYFLKTFGRNSREITCECERSDEPSMVQVLHLANGETLNPKLQSSKRVERWIHDKAPDDAVISELFLAAYSRQPTATEQNRLLTTIGEYSPEERRQALEDLCWSVLSNNEFVFNH